jgi:hypothetical protein
MMNKLPASRWDAVHMKGSMISAGFNNNMRSNIMRRIIIALGLLGAVAAAAPASAQYYGYGPGYGPPAYGPPAYGPGYGYAPAPGPYYRGGYPNRARYAGGNFLRPRFDPRTGGTYCVDRRFTVQDGVCKPYRGY